MSIFIDIEKWIKKRFEKVELYLENFHDYQHLAYDFLKDNPFSALFLDTGLGKTPVLLWLIRNLTFNDESENVLIIGPKRVVEVTWPDEILKWNFSVPLLHTVIRGDELVAKINKAGQVARANAKRDGHEKLLQDAMSSAARTKAAKMAVREMMFDRTTSIYLVHKEQVDFLVDAFGKDWPFDTVIIDESSSLKDCTTNRWKSLWKVRLLIKRMHQLTATPTSEGYLALFAQITLLDKGQRFGKSFPKFRDKYFTQNKWSFKYTLREGAEKEITDLISDICLVMKQEEYLPDLAQPVLSPHQVYLSPEQMELYKTMETESIVELEDGTEVEAETAAALSQKLLQMSSGVLYETVLEEVGDGNFKKRRVVHHIHDNKIEALLQLREELNGESMLIAYYHQSSLDRIMKAIPSAVPMDKAGTCIKKWNSGKIKELLIHPQSDAHGLNLQKGGRHVVFFDIPWSYENYYQLYRRLARQGQKFIVVIHLLIAHGTIDQMVVDCLKEKGDVQEEFFKMITRWRAKIRRLRKKVDDFEL